MPRFTAVTTACGKRTAAAASVKRRRPERQARMRTSLADMRTASQAFERTQAYGENVPSLTVLGVDSNSYMSLNV
jgi:hypothetical protein